MDASSVVAMPWKNAIRLHGRWAMGKIIDIHARAIKEWAFSKKARNSKNNPVT
jgi:hypothetical protein